MSETPTASYIDSKGEPVIDPTKNVLDLVNSAMKRQDDLREMQWRHTREMAELRHNHSEALRAAESARIDAVRVIDVNAVSRAAEVAAVQAGTLAAQVAQSAEALRTQVAQTAGAAQTALTTALDPIKIDIADLRKTQYEQQGQRIQASESTVKTQGSVGNWIAIAAVIVAIILGIFVYATHQSSPSTSTIECVANGKIVTCP